MIKRKPRLGFFVDDASLPNIETQLQLLGEQLHIEYSLDVFYQEGAAESLKGLYQLHQVDLAGGSLRSSSPITHNLSRIFSFAQAGRAYIDRESPAALVGFTNPPVMGTAVGLAATGTPTEAIYRYSGDSFHEYEFMEGLERALAFGHYNGIGRLGLALCDSFIVLGRHGREELLKRGVNKSRIYTIPPAVDAKRFSPGKSSIEFASPGDVGLFVGRLDRRKGADRLVTIIEKVQSSEYDTKFLIVGDGPMLDQFQDFDQRVHVVGRVPHYEIPEYYRAADFLIHPSRIEGLPNVILEARACGLQTITSPVGEMSEYSDSVCNSISEYIDQILMVNNNFPQKGTSTTIPTPDFVGTQFLQMIKELGNHELENPCI